MKYRSWALCVALAAPAAAWAQGGAASAATPSTVYRCPGPPVLYTDAISAAEAKERNCRTIEGAPITIVNTAKPAPRPREGGPAAREGRGEGSKVDPAAQRQRDGDARRLLEAELQREEARLAELLREFNNGEPERLGSERNAQKYLDRVADMRSAIARKQEDIAAIKRELAKLPQQ